MLLSHFSRVWLCATPEMAAQQAPPSLGFSRQEHWSGLPLPSPMHESEKWKWSRSVMSDSSRPHGLQPTRLFHPWDFPGKGTGVGCHRLLWLIFTLSHYCQLLLFLCLVRILLQTGIFNSPWAQGRRWLVILSAVTVFILKRFYQVCILCWAKTDKVSAQRGETGVNQFIIQMWNWKVNVLNFCMNVLK